VVKGRDGVDARGVVPSTTGFEASRRENFESFFNANLCISQQFIAKRFYTYLTLLIITPRFVLYNHPSLWGNCLVTASGMG